MVIIPVVYSCGSSCCDQGEKYQLPVAINRLWLPYMARWLTCVGRWWCRCRPEERREGLIWSGCICSQVRRGGVDISHEVSAGVTSTATCSSRSSGEFCRLCVFAVSGQIFQVRLQIFTWSSICSLFLTFPTFPSPSCSCFSFSFG